MVRENSTTSEDEKRREEKRREEKRREEKRREEKRREENSTNDRKLTNCFFQSKARRFVRLRWMAI
jgi:hypothetical protein